MLAVLQIKIILLGRRIIVNKTKCGIYLLTPVALVLIAGCQVYNSSKSPSASNGYTGTIYADLGADVPREAPIKCGKSACFEKLPSEVGDIQGGMPPCSVNI